MDKMSAHNTGWTAMTGTGSKAGLVAAAAGTASEAQLHIVNAQIAEMEQQ